MYVSVGCMPARPNRPGLLSGDARDLGPSISATVLEFAKTGGGGGGGGVRRAREGLHVTFEFTSLSGALTGVDRTYQSIVHRLFSLTKPTLSIHEDGPLTDCCVQRLSAGRD